MVSISHSSPETVGTYCDGKECFEVLTRGRRIRTTCYWCTVKREHFEPASITAEDCPRKPFTYKPPKFKL